MGRGFHSMAAAALVVSSWAFVGLGSYAEAQGGRTERAEVDPYTKGDPEAMQRAGYRNFGPFLFGEGHTSETVESKLGNVPILWIETEHFRLGSSLDTYRIEGKEERKRLRKELTELGEVLPRIKPKTRSLDPWLRAHLYAQRLEKLHARFCETLGVLPAEAPATEGQARIGTQGPMSVLLVERPSSLSRYTQEYCKTHRDDTHTEYFLGTKTFVYGIAEDSVESDDSALHYAVTFGVTQALAFSIHGFPTTPPRWWSEGLGRYFARLVDQQCQLYVSAGGEALPSDELADWENLVLGRVKAAYYPDWASTLSWSDGSKMKFADHILLWSRMDYLLEQSPEVRAKLVSAFHAPIEPGGDLAARHAGALEAATGKDLEALDLAWSQWVAESYTKKGRKRRGR